MKNIVGEKPTDKLNGRLLFSTKLLSSKNIKNKTLLDIGCGFGWFEFFAVKNNCKKIIGLDQTEKDLVTAKENINSKNVKFIALDSLNLPFKDSIFDTITLWEVLEHIPAGSEEKLFKEIYRVLKRGGSFFLSTPYDSKISKFFDPAWWLIKHRHYSYLQIEKFAKDSGFSIEKKFIKGRYWNLVNILNLYISKWIFFRKRFYSNFFDRKENEEFINENGFMNLFVKLKK